MPIIVKGVEYEFIPVLATQYRYSITYLQELARQWTKGNPKGLKGFKHGKHWYISVTDAADKLGLESKADGKVFTNDYVPPKPERPKPEPRPEKPPAPPRDYKTDKPPRHRELRRMYGV